MSAEGPAPPAGTPLLDIRGLTRDYDGGGGGLFRRKPVLRRALDGVSLRLEAGTILGIVGESGSGKSTLARLAVALDAPTAGTVAFEGDDLFKLAPRALARRRRDFQMVFQDPYGSLDPRQRIGRIVAEPLGVLDPPLRREERAARAVEALESVGLSAGDTLRYPHEFSGGQRQRIAIARALATRPKLVVADEAVSALDMSVQAQILNLVLDLRDRHGTAFLFISHNLAAVGAVADRIGVMYRGRIVETGAAEAFFDNPLHPYSRLLLDAEPFLEAGAKPRSRPPLEGWPEPGTAGGCAFRPRCPLAGARCEHETPLLRTVLADRASACHHAEAMLPGAAGAASAALPFPGRS